MLDCGLFWWLKWLHLNVSNWLGLMEVFHKPPPSHNPKRTIANKDGKQFAAKQNKYPKVFPDPISLTHCILHITFSPPLSLKVSFLYLAPQKQRLQPPHITSHHDACPKLPVSFGHGHSQVGRTAKAHAWHATTALGTTNCQLCRGHGTSHGHCPTSQASQPVLYATTPQTSSCTARKMVKTWNSKRRRRTAKASKEKIQGRLNAFLVLCTRKSFRFDRNAAMLYFFITVRLIRRPDRCDNCQVQISCLFFSLPLWFVHQGIWLVGPETETNFSRGWNMCPSNKQAAGCNQWTCLDTRATRQSAWISVRTH